MPPETILARATGRPEEPEEKPDLNKALSEALLALDRRLSALERRPLAQDGRDGRDGASITGLRLDDKGHLRLAVGGIENDLGLVIGRDGIDGQDGQDGTDGRPGVGVEQIIRVDRRLTISLTDGREIDLGEVAGDRGPPGESIQGPPGEPGQSIKGDPGEPGRDGRDGRGITAADIDYEGRLLLTFTDGARAILARIAGRESEPDGAEMSDWEFARRVHTALGRAVKIGDNATEN